MTGDGLAIDGVLRPDEPDDEDADDGDGDNVALSRRDLDGEGTVKCRRTPKEPGESASSEGLRDEAAGLGLGTARPRLLSTSAAAV